MNEPSSDASLLRVKDASYAYGSVLALTDISFTIEKGEIVALIGRNGAGKSTLLRCVAGWSRLKQGEVFIQGLSLRRSERAARRHLTLVPDTPTFYDDLTAWEHLQFTAQARHLSNWQERAESLLRDFSLWNQHDALPFTFSRGMRYKLAVCLALLDEPSLLLLDEPFGPLDPLSVDRLWRQLQASRPTAGILLSSHQMPADAQPDRYLVVEEGQILAEGTPDELDRRFGFGRTPSLELLLRAVLTRREEARHEK